MDSNLFIINEEEWMAVNRCLPTIARSIFGRMLSTALHEKKEKVLDEVGDKLYCEFHAYGRILDGRDVVKGCLKVIKSLRTLDE